MQKRKFGKASQKPKRFNESELTINALKDLLRSRKDSERTFGKQKLRAYENSEVLKSGVRVKRKEQVNSQPPSPGDTITVRYSGARPDGRFFDAGTISFVLGKGEVIPAWDQAFRYIKEGQDATIFCPSPTAYGKQGAGRQIPPNTTLIFDVSLIKVGRKERA